MVGQRKTKPSRCTSAGRVTARLLLSFLAFSPALANVQLSESGSQGVLSPIPVTPPGPEVPLDAEHAFTLRHLYHHGTYRHPTLARKKDVISAHARIYLQAEDGYPERDIPSLVVRSRPKKIQRLADRRPSVVDPLVADSRRHGSVAMLSPAAWTVEEILFPDVTDKETVLNLALMCSNAYLEDDDKKDWEDIGQPHNRTADFGWGASGLRGHVWADETNSTIVVGLKGTSPAVFDGDGTTTNDKINDNLFFSCCCGQQGQWTWHQVCDCATGPYSCNNTCVVNALRDEHRYYTAARELYSNITELYPAANVWLTGHSLGGSVSALLGLTYGLPTVTFQAVPEAFAARRLGLPVPPGADPELPQARQLTGSFHFGHTADPIFLGTCSGSTASCTYAGYAMETVCHTGMECIYDVVADKGWRVGIGTHKIRAVIHDVIMKYEDVPECRFVPECRDCRGWRMYESNGSDPTTTTTSSFSSSTAAPTRTATCETPGWWGCLDKTTTATTATSTSSTSTSTCQTPGWFGCKDKTSTTTEHTTTSLSVTTTSTTTTSTTTTSCETPGRFWGCDDATSTVGAAAPPTAGIQIPAIAQPTASSVVAPTRSRRPRKCTHHTWYGTCTTWRDIDVGEAFYRDDL